jgi:hypothetical protein
MMDYEIFKEVVAEKMPSYLPGELKGREVMIHPVDKINQTVDGLILKMDGENEKVSPTIYLNDMYEHYKQFGDLQLTLQTVGEAMLKSMTKGVEVQQGLNFDNPEEKIVFQLINTEQNKDMLAHVPHREWKDLSIIYRLVTNVDKDGIESAVVRDGLAEKLGLTEELLFKHAVENTRNIFPPTVRSMNDVMKEIFMADGMPMEAVEMILGEVPADRMMYVISNDRGINGAISMLYEDQLHTLAEQLGTDLYILPSSIHETIAVSVDMGDPEELAQMVSEINMDQVSLQERLSNQVYHYDKDLRVLSMATDTPNKRLDGMAVAEPALIYEAKDMGR